jgi:hypothetical protein
MRNVPQDASSTSDSDSSGDSADRAADIIADVRNLMVERNRAAEKARGGGDGRRSQWA